MEHVELTELTSTDLADIPAELAEKALPMSVEGKMLDLEINCTQIEEDAAAFDLFNIPWQSNVEDIRKAIIALRSAETLYTAEEKMTEESNEAWRGNRDGLYTWRSESVARLTHHAKLTENKSLFASLDKIGDADGHPDAIQDTFESTHLVDVHFPALAVYNLSKERVAEGKAILEICAKAYPQVALGESKISPARDLRNRAFWHLSNLEKQLKEVDLPLVHFDNYERRCEYGSHYVREHRPKK